MTTTDTDLGEDGVLNAGDVIEYSLDVANTGNTCLMDIHVKDDTMSVGCDVWYRGEGVYLPRLSKRNEMKRRLYHNCLKLFSSGML